MSNKTKISSIGYCFEKKNQILKLKTWSWLHLGLKILQLKNLKVGRLDFQLKKSYLL